MQLFELRAELAVFWGVLFCFVFSPRNAIYLQDIDFSFKTGHFEAGNLSCHLERCVKDTVKGDLQTWGRGLIQHCYHTFLNE